MLKQRLIVAAIGLPLLAGLLAVPEPLFSAVIEAILAVATFELVRSAQPETNDLTIPVSAAAATALLVALVRAGFGPEVWALLPLTAIALALLIRGGNPFSDSMAGWWIGSVLYVGILGSHFVLLRDLPDGQRWLVVMLATVFSTDTGAYAVGRTFGRHKMAPTVSPKKTWEGAAGGFACGALAAVIAPIALDLDAPSSAIVLLALGVPVIAEIGDLVESALKRRLGVKDVSHLLPGHGGFLDRLDSLLFAAPWLYWILQWMPN
ncbi:MAG: CDP-archaeol synthase [Chloroflexi bacterium]|nr:CDP-archaeol synthase [Chloroflexota bacterium]MDA1146380.1 CDP-archaeol synthase [Chloroflexota bacterium]MQC82252.1 CDP-archaeol synthase [Chloroflexota bacterium]MQC82689.1 CDP-archaeol synthase [Chloroflexota bacterium]